MSYDPQKHHRRSVRLERYDYTYPAAYFITLCTYGRECLFGEVIDHHMHLSPSGQTPIAVGSIFPGILITFG